MEIKAFLGGTHAKNHIGERHNRANIDFGNPGSSRGEGDGSRRFNQLYFACEQFGSYEEVAEALLCAASLSYGKSPENCVAELQSKGFRFEYEIYATLPNDVTTFDVTYNDSGTPVLPMMREVSMAFSPTVSLYMRTESSPVPLKSAANEYGMQDVGLWEPIEEPPEGKVIGAHLQFFDENSQEWITWTFISPEGYKAE